MNSVLGIKCVTPFPTIYVQKFFAAILVIYTQDECGKAVGLHIAAIIVV
jgi:hypothetical protein